MYKRIILTEQDKKRILNLYLEENFLNEIVITEWLSPDERYCIFLDEVYDIKNKLKIGNIWENFDNFKMFIKHCFETSKEISENIRESVLNQINSLVITESNNNMVFLKPFVRQFLNEEDSFLGKVYDSAVNWGKETVNSAVQGVKDFAKTSWKGIKKTYSYIKNSDWAAAFDIIKKGTLYVARQIRGALYHPVGLILDAILVATGIGKGAQFLLWAIVVGLDIYELTTGNYEDKDLAMGWRLLFFAVDIMGLVFAGAAAKAGRVSVEAGVKTFGKSSEGLSKAAAKSPELKNLLTKIQSGLSGTSSKISEAVTILNTKSPTIGKWLGGLVSGLGTFLQKIANLIKSLLTGTVKVVKAAGAPGRVVRKALGQETKLGKGAQAALNTTALVGGVGIYGQYQQDKKDIEVIDSLVNSSTQPDYSNSDI